MPWKGSWAVGEGHKAWPESMWKIPDALQGVKWVLVGLVYPSEPKGNQELRKQRKA